MLNVKLRETYGSEWRKNFEDPEWVKKFRENWPLLDDKPINIEQLWSIPDGPTRVTEEEAAELMSIGVKLELVPLPGAMITKMQDRAKWDYSMEPTAEHLRSGAAVQIAIPDLGLLQIREVEVMEDACTHALQGMLDEGWRILAVCPPNAARRPDYILGRTTKEK